MTPVGAVARDWDPPRREGIFSVWTTDPRTRRRAEENFFLTQSDADAAAGVVWVQRGMHGEPFSLPVVDLWRLATADPGPPGG